MKTHQMCSLHTAPEKLKHAKFIGNFGCVLEQKSREIVVFEKLGFENFFCPHENEKRVFSNTSALKSVFRKVPFS